MTVDQPMTTSVVQDVEERSVIEFAWYNVNGACSTSSCFADPGREIKMVPGRADSRRLDTMWSIEVPERCDTQTTSSTNRERVKRLLGKFKSKTMSLVPLGPSFPLSEGQNLHGVVVQRIARRTE